MVFLNVKICQLLEADMTGLRAGQEFFASGFWLFLRMEPQEV